MNNKTLYVTDLDGTLMRYDKTVSDYTIDTLNSLIDQGMLITYATARSFHSAWEITKDSFFCTCNHKEWNSAGGSDSEKRNRYFILYGL